MHRWPSFEEFQKWVHPCFHRGPWGRTQRDTLLENLIELSKHLETVSNAFHELNENFSHWREGEQPDHGLLATLHTKVIDITCYADYLLLYWPALAKTRRVGDFLAEKDLHEHWDHYAAELSTGSRKLYYDLRTFIKATERLLEACEELREDAYDYLRDLVEDLPTHLRTDFYTARDFFSVGFEEAGGFFAGRGLEAVLREVARKLRIEIEHKGEVQALHTMDFADIAEAFRRVRWKRDNTPIIDRKLKELLDFLRNARNATAHPPSQRNRVAEDPDWHEVAKISAKAANSIWLASGEGRRKLVKTRILRGW